MTRDGEGGLGGLVRFCFCKTVAPAGARPRRLVAPPFSRSVADCPDCLNAIEECVCYEGDL